MTKHAVKTSSDKILTYTVYHSWVKPLGEGLGYLQMLTTYYLRRALGNAINGTVPRRPRSLLEVGASSESPDKDPAKDFR